MNLTTVLAPWVALDKALGIAGEVRDEAHYEQLLAFVDEAFARFGDDDAHPIFGLVSVVADRLQAYEARAHPWPATATPQTVLAELMRAHGLTQRQLPELGPQSVVSAVLAGRRALNLRQVQALAGRFRVPMEVFLPATV